MTDTDKLVEEALKQMFGERYTWKEGMTILRDLIEKVKEASRHEALLHMTVEAIQDRTEIRKATVEACKATIKKEMAHELSCGTYEGVESCLEILDTILEEKP